MLLVLRRDSLGNIPLIDLMRDKEIAIEGAVEAVYFRDDYIKELENKAREYDELVKKASTLMAVAEALLETINKDIEAWRC